MASGRLRLSRTMAMGESSIIVRRKKVFELPIKTIDAFDVDGPAVTLQQHMDPAISVSQPRLADVLDPTFESGLVAALRLVDVKGSIDSKGRTCPWNAICASENFDAFMELSSSPSAS